MHTAVTVTLQPLHPGLRSLLTAFLLASSVEETENKLGLKRMAWRIIKNLTLHVLHLVVLSLEGI